MEHTTFGFIGLGLIGGSIAKAIRKVYQQHATLLAYDLDTSTLLRAKEEGVLDICYHSLDPALGTCNYLFLCIPVAKNDSVLHALSPHLSKDCLLTDVGSVKSEIHEIITSLQLEEQFIGGHPMTGSEKSGYSHANDRLLENAYYILTPTDVVSKERISMLQALVASLHAIPLLLDCHTHDYITAAVSHLPHIMAASLVNLVRQSDTSDELMKTIAAGGFKDITRIASSSPSMWQQICLSNQPAILSLLKDYIASLNQVYSVLQESQESELVTFFDSAKQYRDSFGTIAHGPIQKIYGFYVDIPDETGVISTIAARLAAEKINLKNIGIVHNREFEEGVLRLEFYDDESSKSAAFVLSKHSYCVYPRT